MSPLAAAAWVPRLLLGVCDVELLARGVGAASRAQVGRVLDLDDDQSREYEGSGRDVRLSRSSGKAEASAMSPLSIGVSQRQVGRVRPPSGVSGVSSCPFLGEGEHRGCAPVAHTSSIITRISAVTHSPRAVRDPRELRRGTAFPARGQSSSLTRESGPGVRMTPGGFHQNSKARGARGAPRSRRGPFSCGGAGLLPGCAR